MCEVVPISVFLYRRALQEEAKMYSNADKLELDRAKYHYSKAKLYAKLYQFFDTVEHDELVDQDDTWINWNEAHRR